MAGYPFMIFVLLGNVINFSNGRAVNISNTWMLPEEGFPVFYRYFRDRISWYEADAVCQFHHAYLVTADTTSQYDAIRAYLKELDIADNVWIGLSKTSEKPNFTWTDFRQLSGEGHWQEAIPSSSKDPLCVAMDPAKDFLWKALSCGGPDIASFICEMPIPSWALGPKGCLLTELPSLTVLYIPEQSSLELTSDCGLDGTKRIACKGNADREEILKQLTCAVPNDDFDDKERTTRTSIASSTASEENGKTTRTWIWTSNTIDVDYGMPTRHRRETEDTLSPGSTRSTGEFGMGSSTTEVFTATNYDTEVTTANTSAEPTEKTGIESAVAVGSDVTTPAAETSTYTTESEASTDEQVIAADFSVIGNGTVIDIIDLNDNSSEPPQPSSPRSSKKLSKNSTVDSKPMTKKEVYKSSDPKSPKRPAKELPQVPTASGKEVPMFALPAGEHEHLNRTFRKEAPRDYGDVDVLNEIPDNHLQENGTDEGALKRRLLPKSLQESPTTTTPPAGAEPEDSQQPNRPNRQRQLTRPQRKSFYPYFFSRVLG